MTSVNNHTLPITTTEGQMIGYLRPRFTVEQDAAELLMKWRNENREWFFDTRPVTIEGTLEWMEGMVKRRHCCLYTIHTPDDHRAVGTYSYNMITPGTVRLDNLIRGEKHGHKALMYGVEAVLLGELFTIWKCEKAITETFADNERVNRLLESVGFTIAGTFNVTLNDGVWSKSEAGRLCLQWENNKNQYQVATQNFRGDRLFDMPEWAK